MSSLRAFLTAILYILVLASPSLAQNAPWPPPAGMSAGEYLQRYGRLYNPNTGGDPRREDPERFRALPDPSRQARPSPVINPPGGFRPEYSPSTGRYELPCSAANRSDPYNSLRPQYNSHTGKYEIPCAKQ